MISGASSSRASAFSGRSSIAMRLVSGVLKTPRERCAF
jgi:hypothetical protein